MIINKKLLLNLLSIRNILTTFFYISSFIFVLGLINIWIFNSYIDNLQNTALLKSNSYEAHEEQTVETKLLLRCLHLYCYKYIDKDNNVYNIIYTIADDRVIIKLKEAPNEQFKVLLLNGNLTENFNMLLPIGTKGSYLIIHTQDRIKLVFDILSKLYFVLSMLLFVFITWFRYITIKHGTYDQRSYKMYVENTIKGNVTEMLHHEINAPLSILQVTYDNVNRSIAERKITLTDTEQKTLEGFKYSLERINTVINFLRQDKHFKQVEKSTILRLVKRVIYDVNILNVIKLDLEMDRVTKHILKHYELGDSLTIGHFLNILNIMVVNSKEAGATTITVEAKVIDNNTHMLLYIKDNGKGIRDKDGKIFKDSENIITQFGYTSKERKDYDRYGKIKTYLKNLFNIRIVDTDSGRGIGLFMVKTILDQAHGHLKLIDTGENGTTFEIMIPVHSAGPDNL